MYMYIHHCSVHHTCTVVVYNIIIPIYSIDHEKVPILFLFYNRNTIASFCNRSVVQSLG